MTVDVIVGAAAGIVAGIVFFGGLRWTVARLATSDRPLVVAGTSFLVRSAVVVVLLVAVADGEFARIVAALAGLLAVRFVMVATVRRSLEADEEASWT